MNKASKNSRNHGLYGFKDFTEKEKKSVTSVSSEKSVMQTKNNKQTIPEGYKQTAVGMIPEEWDDIRIKDCIRLESGQHLDPDQYSFINQENHYPYFTGPTDFTNDVKELSKWTGQGKKFALRNTILITVKGSGVGSLFFLSLNKVAIGRQLMAIDSNSCSILFIYYLLQTKEYRLKQLAAGNMIPGLSRNDILTLQIPLPPLPEQQKIAQILSTWDEAINKVQLIIDNLRLRNKGLAQQLLTGKKRLKGFSGEWNELKADKIFKNHTDKSHNGQLEVLSATQEQGVVPRSMVNIDIKYDINSLSTYKKVEVGDFVISLRSFQGGIEHSSYEGLVSPAYTVLKEIAPISKTFYKVYFKTETFINKLNTIIYGIRDGKQISYKEFATLKLPYPGAEEQLAIAKVLENADKELKLYQQKLTVLKEQKKGLTQKLLTGEVRVKNE